MTPRSSAQYLLRFDDLCTTRDPERWARFLPLIREFALQPILGVVPENRDPELVRAREDEGFWEEMRALQSAGASIGLHGWRHQCVSQGRALIPLHSRSEFAGAPYLLQREWIQRGQAKLRAQGLEPAIWIAPRHGFDRRTLRALRECGLNALSDGFARRPLVRSGVRWIPSQLWAPLDKPSGLWTICLHPNTAADASVAELRRFLQRRASQFTSLERVLAEYPASSPGWRDLAEEQWLCGRARLRLCRGRLAEKFAVE